MVREFKSIVYDMDYDTKVRTDEINFNDLIKKVQQIEQDLDHQSTHNINNNKRNHRLKADDKDDEDSDNGS